MLLFVAMFLCIFPLMKHLVSSRKDVCQMKHVFSTSNTAFCRISQLSCFFFFMNNPALCVNSKIFLSLLFLFFDQCSLASSLSEMHYRYHTTWAKIAQR